MPNDYPNIETRRLRDVLANLPTGQGDAVVGTDLTEVFGLLNTETVQDQVEAIAIAAVGPAIDTKPLYGNLVGGGPYYIPDLKKQKVSAFDGMSLSQRQSVKDRVLVDVSAPIQAAEDYLTALGGGTIYFDDGLYGVTGLLKKYRVSWQGGSNGTLNETHDQQMPVDLKGMPGATVPMVRNDPDSGYERNTSSIDGLPQRYALSEIRGIRFDGNPGGNSDTRAVCLELLRQWSMRIVDCQFFSNSSGLAVNLLDCNAIVVENNASIGGWFVESMADSYFGASNWFAGFYGGGPYTLFHPSIWFAGPGNWKNIHGQNFACNNTSNRGAIIYNPTVSGDTFTVAGGHLYQDRSPVNASPRGGTLPAGLSETQVYYVKRLSGTQFKLATSRATLNAGTYVTTGSAGSGSWAIMQGLDTALYLQGVTGDSFTGWRTDQGYGPNVLLNNSQGNTIASMTSMEAGRVQSPFPDLGPQAAIKLINGSTGNSFPSPSLLGDLTDFNSGQQNIGFEADASSSDNFWPIDGNVIGHSDAALKIGGVALGLTRPSTEPIFLGSDRFEATAGSPTIGLVGGGRRSGWLFDANVQEIIATELILPPSWPSFSIRLRWVNAGAGSGNVRWLANIGDFAVGQNLNAVDANSVVGNYAAGAQDVLMETVLTINGFSNTYPGKTIFLRINREGGDAGDTLGNDVALLAVILEKAAS